MSFETTHREEENRQFMADERDTLTAMLMVKVVASQEEARVEGQKAAPVAA
jgi:hypothetical protein